MYTIPANPTECIHAASARLPGARTCRLNLHCGRPSPAECAMCRHRVAPHAHVNGSSTLNPRLNRHIPAAIPLIDVRDRFPGSSELNEKLMSPAFGVMRSQALDPTDVARVRYARPSGDSFKRGRYLQSAPMIFTADLNPVFLTDMYRGRSAFLIAGGPSFASLDHSKLRQPGMLTMAVNNAVKSFRTNLWTCVDDPSHFIRSIWLDPTMLKFCPIGNADKQVFDSDRWAWTNVTVRDCPSVFFYRRNAKFQAMQWLYEDTFNWGNAKERGGGRSVLLVAIRLLFHLGVRQIYLLGVDLNMDRRTKYHFDQDRAQGSIRGNTDTYRKIQRWFGELMPLFKEAGLSVFNCNPQSRLTVFEHVPFEQAISEASNEWGSINVQAERTAGLYDLPKPRN